MLSVLYVPIALRLFSINKACDGYLTTKTNMLVQYTVSNSYTVLSWFVCCMYMISSYWRVWFIYPYISVLRLSSDQSNSEEYRLLNRYRSIRKHNESRTLRTFREIYQCIHILFYSIFINASSIKIIAMEMTCHKICAIPIALFLI